MRNKGLKQLLLPGIRPRKVSVAHRLHCYLQKCLRCGKRSFVRVRLDQIAETFGVSRRTIERALAQIRAGRYDSNLIFRTVTRGGGGRGWEVICTDRAGVEPYIEHFIRGKWRKRVVKNFIRGFKILSKFSRRLSDIPSAPLYTLRRYASDQNPEPSWPSGQRRDREPAARDLKLTAGEKLSGLRRYCFWLARDLWARNNYDNAKLEFSSSHLFSLVWKLKRRWISDDKIYRTFAWAFIETHKAATDFGLNNGDHGKKFCLSHTSSLVQKKLLGGV